MTALGFVEIPPELWPRVAGAAHRLLILDFDGTIAPFSSDRRQTAPHPGILGMLGSIASSPRTTVAIVSGRPVHEVEPHLMRFPVRVVGEHGWEARSPGGDLVLHPVPLPSRMALDDAAQAAEAGDLGQYLERKRASLVLHTRSLPPEKAAEIERACERVWRTWFVEGQVRLLRMQGGLELRAVGRDKGTAVLELLGSAPRGALPIYLGDDETDEDAFGALRESGLTLRVGSTRPGTLAHGRLASLDEVARFFEIWLARVSGLAAIQRESP